MMSLWDALRMNMMISYQELVRTFPKTIAELTKERLRRAGKKVREDNPEWNGDIGFRVFKLDTSNIRPWEATAESLSQQLDAYISPIIEGRSEEDLLAELMLKRGIDLCVNVETRQFDGLTVSCVDGGKLFTCFTSQIPASCVEVLTKGIIDWHKSLKAGKDTVAIFLMTHLKITLLKQIFAPFWNNMA